MYVWGRILFVADTTKKKNNNKKKHYIVNVFYLLLFHPDKTTKSTIKINSVQTIKHNLNYHLLFKD